MENNYIKTLPHGKDMDAVSGYRYIGDAEQVLSFWSELVENGSIFTGVNFDLSGDIEKIDRNRKLYIRYDFLHRVMLCYYIPKEEWIKEMNLEDFKKYIGV